MLKETLTYSIAVILCNDTVRTMLINYARSIMFSVAPSFPMLASIRATYQLLRSGETQGVWFAPSSTESSS